MVRNNTPAGAASRGSGRGWLARGGLCLALLLPLWGVWAYAYATMARLKSDIDMLPNHYRIHLYKEQIRGRFELFAKIVDAFAREGHQPVLEYLSDGYSNDNIGQMASLFGLEKPFLVLKRDGLRTVYPVTPEGVLAEILGDDGRRGTLFQVIAQMTATGEKYGYCSFADSQQSAGTPAGWHVVVAYPGQEFLCVLLIPESLADEAGETLRCAQETLLQERLHRFVMVTLPILSLASLLIGLLCFRALRPGTGCTQERAHESRR